MSRISIMKTQWSHTSGSREPSAGQREVEIWISVRANIHLSHCAYSPVQVGRYTVYTVSPDYEDLLSIVGASVVRHCCYTALGAVHISDATIQRCSPAPDSSSITVSDEDPYTQVSWTSGGQRQVYHTSTRIICLRPPPFSVPQ